MLFIVSGKRMNGLIIMIAVVYWKIMAHGDSNIGKVTSVLSLHSNQIFVTKKCLYWLLFLVGSFLCSSYLKARIVIMKLTCVKVEVFPNWKYWGFRLLPDVCSHHNSNLSNDSSVHAFVRTDKSCYLSLLWCLQTLGSCQNTRFFS